MRNGAEWFLDIGPGIVHPEAPPPRNGNKGNGFSVQVVNGHALDLRRLCKLLDELSGMIRKDAGTNWH